MIAKPFGATGVSVASIGQGTWDLPQSGARREQAVRALRHGIELGMTHIDTAEMYGAGRVEELVGEAIAGLDRGSLFVTTKVLPGNASYAGTMAACERSLRRLRTDYVDLYLLHWPGAFPLEDTMSALEALVAAGKTRFIGVSNFDVEELEEARRYLRSVPLACDQVLHHLRERTAESRLLPYCERNGIAFVGYTPFGRSQFPSREAQPGGLLGRIARRYGKSVRQVILNFLTRSPAAFAIPKASSPEHVEENAGAAGWSLDAADAEAIDTAFPVSNGPIAKL